MCENDNFLNAPYGDRQLIAVVPDKIALATKEAKKKVEQNNQNDDWVLITELVLATVPFVSLTVEIVKALGRARQNGIQVITIGKSEAGQIRFPPGHPREGVLYIGHPAISNVYYTTAEFHRVTFEHKFSEAVRVLMHLGATKIRVEHISGWSKEFSSRISAPLGEVGISAETGTNKGMQSQLLYEASLGGTARPQLPDDMVWYPHEPTWQSVAEGRLQFGLKTFSLSVSYEDDFGVNAGLKAAAMKSGLEIGGRFEDHQSTVWRLEGTFGYGDGDT